MISSVIAAPPNFVIDEKEKEKKKKKKKWQKPIRLMMIMAFVGQLTTITSLLSLHPIAQVASRGK